MVGQSPRQWPEFPEVGYLVSWHVRGKGEWLRTERGPVIQSLGGIIGGNVSSAECEIVDGPGGIVRGDVLSAARILSA